MILRSVDENEEVIGDHNDNPILNTMLYGVEFPDEVVKPYAANTIAENILVSVELDGYHCQMLDCILDHKKEAKAVDQSDQ